MSYSVLIRRCASDVRWRVLEIMETLRKNLQPGERPHADKEAPARQKDDSSPSLEHVVGRSIFSLDWLSGKTKAMLSAISEDMSNHLVPKGDTKDLGVGRTHHLGRWYMGSMSLEYEYRQIEDYLHNVAADTERARRRITALLTRSAGNALRVQIDANRRIIQQYRADLEAVAYTMACELKVARLDRQWHRIWKLERRLALTASLFLPSIPLAPVCKIMRNSDDLKITEISMSRMAQWDDSYESFYKQDVQTRRKMNLVKRYWTVLNSPVHKKPWDGESRIFTVTSPVSTDKEYIVIRDDQRSVPSPLWPLVWGATGPGEAGAGSTPKKKLQKMEQRSIPTPSGTGRYRRRTRSTTTAEA